MKPLTVVKPEVFSQASDGLGRVLVIVQVDLFVFDAAPEPFDEDVVQRTASPVHTDGDLALFEKVLVQIFDRRQTEPIFNFSLRGKHCFPYLQDHGSWTGDL